MIESQPGKNEATRKDFHYLEFEEQGSLGLGSVTPGIFCVPSVSFIGEG